MSVQFSGVRPVERFWQRGLRFLAFLLLVLGFTGGVIGLGAYGYFATQLPEFSSIDDYRPALGSAIYSQDGQLIGEIFKENRQVLSYDRIPPLVVQAFLASEDAGFFDHTGIDYFGIFRAAIANLLAGRVVQGGSTVTQQVAKSLLISAEGYEAGVAKKLGRKLKEAILARRLERVLSKEEILTIYLNQIFLGNQAYGVQVAARNYFHKNVDQLNLAEAALLGGLPQAPSRYSPFQHPDRAVKRREYVLRRMLEVGVINEAELNEAKALPLVVYQAKELSKEVTPYFTEQVRRELFDRYDEKTVLTGGLKVWTSVDVERYRAAEDATYQKLRMVDRRQGYRGALAQFKSEAKRQAFLKRYDDELRHRRQSGPLKKGEVYLGLITRVDHEAQHIHLTVGSHEAALLPMAAMRWAREVNPQVRFDSAILRKIPKSFAVGDVILVRATDRETLLENDLAAGMKSNIPEDPKIQLVRLEQEPILEAALLSEDVESGYILAMLGGYSFDRSEFNRAIQACRQPGSAFKPIFYSGVLELKKWTPATTVLDAPVAFNDPSARKRWKPNNFASQYLGEVTLRMALQRSMNIPSIRVLDSLGLKTGLRWAKRLGIETELREELGLALGSSCVRMSELTEVYRLFANYGKRIPKRMILRIEDRDGKLLFDQGYPKDAWAGAGTKLMRADAWLRKPAKQVISKETGYLITKMMRNVVDGGTGGGARAVGVPVAGKTGTTNDSFDAWFVGYTPEIVTAVWVGFDDYTSPMGRYEQGGRAALPIWVSYMKRAIKDKTGDFVPPESIVFAHIDPKTGERRSYKDKGAVLEAFVRGTAPKDVAPAEGEEAPGEFFLLDH